MASVHVHVVGCNQARYLARLFDSLRLQTYADVSVLYVDNHSTDGSLELVRTKYPEVTCLKNTNDLGETGGHNQGFQLALSKWPVGELDERFVLLMHPEAVLAPTCVEELVRAARANPTFGAFGPKVLKMYASEGLDRELEQVDATTLIESTGLVRFPSGRIVERGCGEEDRGQFASGDVWGISGMVMLLRASALEAVREGDSVYDADFFSGGADADLSWRLTRKGFSCAHVATAVAYRYIGRFRDPSSTSPQLRMYAYRNRLLSMAKNLGVRDALVSAHRLIPREAWQFVKGCVTEPRVTARALMGFLALLPRMWKKR